MAAPQTFENWVGPKRKVLDVIRRLFKFLLSDVKISPLKILSRRVMWPDLYFKRIHLAVYTEVGPEKDKIGNMG